MPKQITKSDSKRIMSSQSKNGHYIGKNSFSARTQSAADKYNNLNSKKE